jgi:hypothetical protein
LRLQTDDPPALEKLAGLSIQLKGSEFDHRRHAGPRPMPHAALNFPRTGVNLRR